MIVRVVNMKDIDSTQIQPIQALLHRLHYTFERIIEFQPKGKWIAEFGAIDPAGIFGNQ
jgi:hypothetical protein